MFVYKSWWRSVQKRAYHQPLVFTEKLDFLTSPSTTDGDSAKSSSIPTLRFCNEAGELHPRTPVELTKMLSRDRVLGIFKRMLLLQAMDTILYEAQRQGRISFYMTNSGEEATHFGAAAALQSNDPVFAQYREAGVLLERGFPLQQMLHQLLGNWQDFGKGRQMPIHYGSAAYSFQTISSPLATQMPQAVGAGYFLKGNKEPAGDGSEDCSRESLPICFFGEGAASEGDAHAAFNFAATLQVPMIFFCRNNSFAISTPTHEQYRGDGIAARGPAYGIPAFRVDGNDLWAVWWGTRVARQLALSKSTPVLIEAITHRFGHHSTSDDSSAYRSPLVPEERSKLCPVARIQRHLNTPPETVDAWREDAKQAVLNALIEAEKHPKPPIDDLFTDVYCELSENLLAQRAQLRNHLGKYQNVYNHDTIFKS